MIMFSILTFIIAITLIVLVHEFGHFWVARMFDIKVLRFSIGFGKPLWRFFDKTGTEFVIAAIPMGGYVKMLDERESEVKAADLPYAFNRKPLWIRTLVVMAGPVFNIVFAFAICWLVFVIGSQVIVPKIGNVSPHSVAAITGIKNNTIIKAIDNHPVNDWQDVLLRLTESFDANGNIAFTMYSPKDNQTHTFLLPKQNWHMNSVHPDPLASLGIEPYIPPIPPVIFKVLPDTPAAQVGLQANDKIIALAGKKITDWSEMQAVVLQHINVPISIEISRDNKQHSYQITPAVKRVHHKTMGYLGIESKPVAYPKELIHEIRYNPFSAIVPAFKETIFISKLTLKLLIKLFTGQVSVRTLSGPVGIAEGAGNAASLGITSYLDFIAFLSISIGIINILPIPLLDGGHLLYFMIESVTGRPVSEKVQEIGLRIGILILASLTLFVFYNDLSRLFT